jgi:hypothetical protein
MAFSYWNNTGAGFFIQKKKIKDVNIRGLFAGMGPFSICFIMTPYKTGAQHCFAGTVATEL